MVSLFALSVLLFFTLVLPSSVVGLGLSSSTGLFLVILFHLLLLPLGRLHCRKIFFLRLMVIANGFLLAILLHGLACFLINRDFYFDRFIFSYTYLLLFLLSAFSFVLLVGRMKSGEVASAVKTVFYLLILTGIAGIFDYSPWFLTEKPVFFFSEPSHFALAFLPFFFYALVVGGAWSRALLVIAALILAALLENLTLVAGILIAVFLVFGLLRSLCALTACVVFLVVLNGLDYYITRLSLNPESTNLSVLVYLSGWEQAYLNLKESYGLGIGLNQLGLAGSSGEMTERLTEYAGQQLNALDGGFVAAKLISEFGLFGVAVLIVYLACFLRNVGNLRVLSQQASAPKDHRTIFFVASFQMFFVSLFVRGTGYFSSASFLFIAAMIWMAFCYVTRSDRTDSLATVLST